MICYKIKVGIEEYPVSEVDISRIVAAMKSNDMVKLDCGVFRGQAILAVCRDFDEENRQLFISSPQRKEIDENEEREKILKEQKEKCLLCNKTGWVYIQKGNEKVAKYCSCTILKPINEP